MPLNELVQVIETLKARIVEHGDDLKASEALTRLALIQPVLRTLGWDTEDPALVQPEYPLGNVRADYALLRTGGTPAAVIKAKKLGEPLKNHLNQMLTYANGSGIPYACLTDGDHWELYEVFVAKPIDERRILQASIAKDGAYEAALRFLLLWRPNMASGTPMEAKGPVLVDMQGPAVAGNGGSSAPAAAPEAPLFAPPGWVALTSLAAVTGQGAPSAVRFPDGHEGTVKNWSSLLVEIGKWLDGKGLMVPSVSPLPQGPFRYLLNISPAHKNGQKFVSPRQMPQSGLYLDTHASSSLLVRNGIKLLNACGQDPANIYVRPQAT